MKQIKIFFCPKCKSKNVKHFFALRNLFGLIPRWKCKDCGFESSIFPMLIINKSKLKKLNKDLAK